MKKILFIFLTFFLSINIVLAKENKLSISSSDNKLYYDSNLLDTNTFMKHLDMIPGSTFTDNLIIENETKFNFNLYLKINNRNNNELLDYMTMKIYLDEKLVYDGDMIGSGLFYENDALNNSFLVGNFSANQLSNLRVVTNLSTDYSNINNNDSLIIDWKFYAETKDDINKKDDIEEETIIEIIPAPITGINIDKLPVIIISSGLCLVSLIAIIILIKKKNKDDKYEEDN